MCHALGDFSHLEPSTDIEYLIKLQGSGYLKSIHKPKFSGESFHCQEPVPEVNKLLIGSLLDSYKNGSPVKIDSPILDLTSYPLEYLYP